MCFPESSYSAVNFDIVARGFRSTAGFVEDTQVGADLVDTTPPFLRQNIDVFFFPSPFLGNTCAGMCSSSCSTFGSAHECEGGGKEWWGAHHVDPLQPLRIILHKLANIIERRTCEGAMFVEVSEASPCQAVRLQLGASAVQVHATSSHEQLQDAFTSMQYLPTFSGWGRYGEAASMLRRSCTPRSISPGVSPSSCAMSSACLRDGPCRSAIALHNTCLLVPRNADSML
ncbi:hypothetical protein HW555_005558 [Spodoptera exigua]|uniref:Uncharacterized protein n=1 Tax=Spodoptera exigua TaxID=7107 RepID=A0A835GIA4_SPOEX|nr:hypothetical protein HW555_005558 [Spodoptera exigua]